MESPFATAAPRTGGQRLGRYRLVRPLSKGGMALVYEARRESLAGVSPRVAVKLILPEHASSETFKELFINEARLGASMQHQNLVQIQDFDAVPESDGGETYFLVMEYVEGLTLRKVISLSERIKTPIPLGAIAEIGRQACDGLHYAHTARDERGRPLHLVHRDIKPSNLILNPQGIVKVLDFGISKGRLREERKGSVKGTWGYMAPEQAVGADVGPTADVFGLGVVLYELASLRPMFVDQPKDEMRRLLRDDHAARMAATLDGPTYGPLIGVLVRALQRDPAARFETAAAFGRALSALLPDPITARDEVVKFWERLDALDRGARLSPRSRAPASPDATPASPVAESAVWTWAGVATFVAGVVLSLGGLAAVLVAGLSNVPRARPAGGPGGAAAEIVRAVPASAAAIRDRSVPVDEPAGPNGDGAPGEAPRGERAPPPDTVAPGPIPLGDRPGLASTAPIGDGAGPESLAEPGGPAATSIQVREPGSSARVEVEPGVQAGVEPSVEAGSATGATGTLVIDARQEAEVYLDGRFVSMAPFVLEAAPGGHTVSIVAKDGRRHTFEVELAADARIERTWDFDRMDWR
ncbi:MAG: protein kinase [Myxococcota bacterium]